MAAAPLRKVVKRKSREKTCEMTQRGRSVSVRWTYEAVITLECGHVIVTRDSAPHSDRMRCKKCLAASVPAGGAAH